MPYPRCRLFCSRSADLSKNSCWEMQSPPLCYKSGLNSVAIPKCQHPFRNANFNTCFMMRNARLGRRLGGLSGWLPVLDRDEDRRKRIIKESLRICGTGNCISSVTPVCHLKTGSAKRNNAPDERSPRSKNVHMLSTGATSRMKRIVVLFINNATCKKKRKLSARVQPQLAATR